MKIWKNFPNSATNTLYSITTEVEPQLFRLQ